MKSTMVGRLLFVLFLAFAAVCFCAYAAEAKSVEEVKSVNGPILLISMCNNEIPQRCIDYDITSVSCAHVVSNDALMPHPDDCQLFYYCVNADSAPICRQCPAGLHFNPQKHVCDVPKDAGCVSTPPMNTTETLYNKK